MQAADATRLKCFVIEHSCGKVYLWKAASLSNLVAKGQKFGHIWDDRRRSLWRCAIIQEDLEATADQDVGIRSLAMRGEFARTSSNSDGIVYPNGARINAMGTRQRRFHPYSDADRLVGIDV